MVVMRGENETTGTGGSSSVLIDIESVVVSFDGVGRLIICTRKLRRNPGPSVRYPCWTTMTYAASRSSAVVTSNAAWAALTTSAYSVVHSKSAATGRWTVLPKSFNPYSTPHLPVLSTLPATRPL